MAFTLPNEAWTAINTFGLVALAVVGYLTQRLVRQVKEAVDEPLSLAIKQNAELSKINAELTKANAERTGDHVDLAVANQAAQVAIVADAVNKNREEGKALSPLPTPPNL